MSTATFDKFFYFEKMVMKQIHIPAVLPLHGKSRWSQIKQFSPVCRETFRKLSKAGKAPPAERMGIRCTFYDNAELHRWLSDPINYRVDQEANQ